MSATHLLRNTGLEQRFPTFFGFATPRYGKKTDLKIEERRPSLAKSKNRNKKAWRWGWDSEYVWSFVTSFMNDPLLLCHCIFIQKNADIKRHRWSMFIKFVWKNQNIEWSLFSQRAVFGSFQLESKVWLKLNIYFHKLVFFLTVIFCHFKMIYFGVIFVKWFLTFFMQFPIWVLE